MLIGLTGYRHSGRNIVAEHLVTRHGFVRMAFADPVYRLLLAADPLISSEDLTDPETLTTILKVCGGWRGLKNDPTFGPRVTEMMQDLGSSVREQFGSDACIHNVTRRIDRLPPRTDVVITDVRLVNEAEYVRDHGGVIWRIEKDGTGPLNGDITEQRLPDEFVDLTLTNSGLFHFIREIESGLRTGHDSSQMV